MTSRRPESKKGGQNVNEENMPTSLTFRAGARARRLIAREGLDPAFIRVIPAASGGPKWLGLVQLDRAILSAWFVGDQARFGRPIHVIGSSIGAWRMACYAQADPLAAFERFSAYYLDYRFGDVATSEIFLRDWRETLGIILDGNAPNEILSHPYFRTNIMAVRSRGLTAADRRSVQTLALAVMGLANLVSRRTLKYGFERTLFHDARDRAPFFGIADFPIQRVPLSASNLADALLATATIPVFMHAVRGIAGAPAGAYRDGGLIDYHFDIPFLPDNPETSGERGIVFYPHFRNRIVPGWFDKKLPWRKAKRENLEDVLLVAPSREFLETLPHGKIPDRGDFTALDNDTRLAYWRRVVAETERMADEFLEVLEHGDIEARLEEFD